ncbi:MAG: YfiR family protein [Nitrospirota bacterium]|nr:YfiR family protein [Nitrospirota bacterium]
MAILNHHRTACEGSRCNPRVRSLPIETGGARAALRTALTALCIVIFSSVCTGIRAQAQEPNAEYQLKAAFLFNFAKFVEWPDSSSSSSSAPLTICVLGNDPFGASLDAIEEKTIKGRALAVKRLRSIGGTKDCQILYVSPNELTHMAEIVRSLQKTPVLTVCDVESCAEAGIMLNMRMVENRVQLDMNLDVVQRTPLKVSSQLMKLTRIVKGEP